MDARPSRTMDTRSLGRNYDLGISVSRHCLERRLKDAKHVTPHWFRHPIISPDHGSGKRRGREQLSFRRLLNSCSAHAKATLRFDKADDALQTVALLQI